jgi:L-arabinokinase
MFHALVESASWGESESTLRLAGELLVQSHVAYADCGLGSAVCDDLVARALRAGLPGAKMTGGGAGGVVALLGRAEQQCIVESILDEFSVEQGQTPHLFEGSSAGADSFHVRTIELRPAKELR